METKETSLIILTKVILNMLLISYKLYAKYI